MSQQQPIRLDALGPDGRYHARNRLAVTDVTGRLAAELSQVPPVLVTRAIQAMRRARPMPAPERAAALARAGELFASAELGGLTRESYEDITAAVSGLPIPVVRAAASAVAERVSRASAGAYRARPAACGDWHGPQARAGTAVWTRRAGVLAVHAAGNHPGTHSIWPQALALGYRVAVRPSRREPFTPHRLVTALRAAGFGDDQVALLPTDHRTADTLVRDADLGVVYGGDEVVRQYGGSSRVLTQGPGRSKVLVTASASWRDYLDTIVASVSQHGGTGCVNASAILVEGDPEPLAAALAQRLAALPSLPPADERAVLPVQPAARAQAIERYVLGQAAGCRAWLGGEGICADLGDGSAVLRPAVHQVADARARQAGIEMPFPCAWVAPWHARDGVAPLRGTLALTVLTRGERLVADLLDEAISNVYTGEWPTCRFTDGLPHDGYLAEFLMRSKSFASGQPAGPAD